tara:strand:+ start:71472 stop:71693 length:222 start_codon:yes stop_codon:yes gene_type:complete
MEIEFYIKVEELDPPVGRVFTHAAKVQFMAIRTPDGNIKNLNPNFGEVHGKSAQEAEQKMQEKVEKWRRAQPQ